MQCGQVENPATSTREYHYHEGVSAVKFIHCIKVQFRRSCAHYRHIWWCTGVCSYAVSWQCHNLSCPHASVSLGHPTPCHRFVVYLSSDHCW